MRKRILIFVLAVLNVAGTLCQTATGFVYSDDNRNGLKDKNEKGLEGVAVSNGKDVVLTGKNGTYSIPAPDNTVIFVSKPSGYKLPVNQWNIPQFYYLHYPNGSSKLRYAGIKPTGKLPESINFGLIPSHEADTFKCLFFGDTQPYVAEQVGFLTRDVLPELIGKTDYEFVSILGDIVGDRLSLYPLLTEAMSLLKIPVFYVQGNHDMNYDVTSDQLASETYKATFGPKNYSFNYGKVHFVVLDDIIYSGDTMKRYYTEGFDDEVITFLKNDLAVTDKNKLVVLMMHAPFINRDTHKGILNLDKILTELSKFPYTFSISAHNHTISQYMISNEEGWLRDKPHHHFNAGATCGDWWQGTLDEAGLPAATMRDGSPNGYVVATFQGNKYTMDYKASRQPESHQMNIFAPKVVGNTKNLNGWNNDMLYVNFFTGTPGDTVRYRIDGGKWTTMQYTVEQDPTYFRYHLYWEDSNGILPGDKPSSPDKCYHLWKAFLPLNLPKGFRTIEVEATDVFGKKHRDYQVVKVE
jgi:hypothetical protein